MGTGNIIGGCLRSGRWRSSSVAGLVEEGVESFFGQYEYQDDSYQAEACH